MPTRTVMLAASLCAALGCPALAQERASAYSKHAYQTCPKVKPDEDGVAVHRCAGIGGIAVTWTAGDDSSAVGFGTGPVDETAVAAPFFEAGSTIEWRGPKGGRPQAAILRYRTGQRVGKLDGGRLVVYRLGTDGRSCIVGSVDGRKADANAAARKLADDSTDGFRCGQDKRLD